MRPCSGSILPRGITFALLLAMAAGLSPAPATAATFETYDAFHLQSGQVLSNELWMVTGKLDIDGETHADLFFLASEAHLDGTLRQDVWGIANTEVIFTGHAEDDLRLVGQRSLQVDGTVEGGLTGLGETIKLSTNAVVQGAAFLTGQHVILEGRIEGPARINAFSATLNGYFGGDVRLTSEDIAIMPGTVIRGNLTYTSSHDLVLDDRVQLDGTLEKVNLAGKTAEEKAAMVKQQLMTRAFFCIGAILVGIPLLFILPVFTSAGTTLLRSQRGRCLFTGAILFFAVPLFALVALLSLVGIPLSLTITGSYLILLYLGKILVAVTVGSLLVKQASGRYSPMQRVIALSLGLLIIYALTALPIVGTAIWLLVSFAGLGAGFLSILFAQRSWTVSFPGEKTKTGEPAEAADPEPQSEDQEPVAPKEE